MRPVFRLFAASRDFRNGALAGYGGQLRRLMISFLCDGAMLERSSLLLSCWMTALPGGRDGRVRTVGDPEGETYGFVYEAVARGARWRSWASRQRMDVCEKPDDSLVFSLIRGWGWLAAWELYDADERQVGAIRGRALMDGFGYLLAAIDMPVRSEPGRFLSAEGRVLGQFSRQSSSTMIQFAADLEGNPFARMLLLGGLLVAEF